MQSGKNAQYKDACRRMIEILQRKSISETNFGISGKTKVKSFYQTYRVILTSDNRKQIIHK